MDTTSPQFMVYQALDLACSQDATQIKQAEAKLAEWEVEPGFYTMLQALFADQSVNMRVRWLAAVYFKNGVNKYWRKNANHEINQAEKEALRAALLSRFDEPVPQIAAQIATLIAKIARLDCPRDWPQIIPVLIDAVQVADHVPQHGALLVLQHVVKALSTKRLYADRRAFEQLSTNVYPFVLNLWDVFTTLYFQSVRNNQSTDTSISLVEKALLSLRILRKLTIYGFAKPHLSDRVLMFLKSIFVRLKESLECRLQVKLATQARLTELTEKFILKQMKILNEFVEQHPVSFVEFIPCALEFSFHYVFNEGANMIFENNEISFQRFAIHCINLMKGILCSTAYQKSATIASDALGNAITPRNSDGTSVAHPEIAMCAMAARKEFFTPIRLNYICEKVIMHYFQLTPQDLETWDEDPETFAAEDGGDSWKYSLRPCTETFFLALFNQFRQDMTPEVVKYIQKAQAIQLQPDSDMKTILGKDAIYNAAGLALFNLFDEVNFDEWFTQQLSGELKIDGMNFRILRRRVILLIGQWTSSKELRPQVYAACLHLLGANEDMCVRIAASKTLMTTMDDFEFEQDTFKEFLEPSFSLLYALLKDAKECDTKMNVLFIMSFIIERMSQKIQSQAQHLIQYLPLLWEESHDHNMLRCAIISTLVQIVKASSEIPPALVSFLYPVIGISTNKDDPSHIYLLEEGLELWLVVVENSTVLTPELFELSTNLLSIIESTSENLRTTLYIIQSYILLNPAAFLFRHGKDIVKCCQYLLSDMRSEGIVMVMKLYEDCLRCKPDVALDLLRPALANIFRKVADNDEYPMVMTMYLAIAARVLIIDQNVFIHVLQEVNETQFLERMLDVWINKMPLVTQLDKRKLLSLALTSLLTAQNDIIYDRFSSIIHAVCETLNDIMKDDDDSNVMVDSLIYTDDVQIESNGMWTMEDFEYKTFHYERCRQLCLTDPVHTVELKKYVQSQLDALRSQLGLERFNSLLATLLKPVLNNLTDYVTIESFPK